MGQGGIVELQRFVARYPEDPDMKLFASLLMSAALAVPAFPAFAAGETPVLAKPDLAKGEESFGTVCAACHGPDGNSTVPLQPKLAGQHPEYLIKQLEEFKSGVRDNAIMKGMAATLATDDDVRNVAWWLSTQKPNAGAAADKDLVLLGERIYRGGISERSIAACASCHSPNGAGLPVEFPRLAGQYAEYVAKQLTDFRDGARGNNVVMRDVAAKLNDREIKAVADYIAGLH